MPRQMMATRKRRGGSRNLQKPSDDGGCLLLLLLVAWGLGFVSFHSRETGRTIARAAELREELANADKRLAELTAVVTAIREQSLDLDKERDSLQAQVRQLERARNEIASSLSSAAGLISPTPQGRVLALVENVFTGVIGNLLATGVIGLVAWLWGRRTGRREVERGGNDVACPSA